MTPTLEQRRRNSGLATAFSFSTPTGAVNETMNKGHIIDTFSYGQNKIAMKKTGAEISEKLAVQKAIEESKRDALVKECDALRSSISEAPEQDMDEYQFKGVKSKLGFVPKLYSFEQVDAHVDVIMGSEETANPTFTTIASHKKYADEEVSSDSRWEHRQKCPMHLYNECARKLVECSVEIILVDVMMNNLQPTAKYDLNVDQLATLGF